MAYGVKEDVLRADLFNSIEISWCVDDCGWGSFRIYPPKSQGGKVTIDDEMIGKEAIKTIICKMIDDGEIM